ncbi:peroxiredoxin [Sphingobacteriaceae bacterium]|nr:peroxiredoxin [Sphingobacteriaceae bacterium]
MDKEHHYTLTVAWTGNKGQGTSAYTAYDRSHSIKAQAKVNIEVSSDPSFRGDKTKYNPEELFLSSLSSCHMLWYLHLCSEAGVVVTDYVDHPEGTMIETKDGGGYFNAVTLHPEVTVANQSMVKKAADLHHDANKKCFIANSCNFLIEHEVKIKVQRP